MSARFIVARASRLMPAATLFWAGRAFARRPEWTVADGSAIHGARILGLDVIVPRACWSPDEAWRFHAEEMAAAVAAALNARDPRHPERVAEAPWTVCEVVDDPRAAACCPG